MIEASRKQWIRFGVVLALYLLFIIWLKSWLGIVVIPFIFDAYITKKIPWTWWKKSKNKTVLTVMGWVDTVVFARKVVACRRLSVCKQDELRSSCSADSASHAAYTAYYAYIQLQIVFGMGKVGL